MALDGVGNLNVAGSIQYDSITYLADGSDLNTLVTGGTFYITEGSVNAPPIPDNRGLAIMVIPDPHVMGPTQFVWGNNDSTRSLYMRQFALGAWEPWNFFTSTPAALASVKTFVIPHPLAKDKMLTHATLEGPEVAVFYRGEARTKAGLAEITLPEYFEALTQAKDRAVLVTALFENDEEEFGQLAASRVADGKFRVRSSNDSQRFYWEVKAVRKDVAPLEVVTDIPEKRVK
jgi:hypothetical protein